MCYHRSNLVKLYLHLLGVHIPAPTGAEPFPGPAAYPGYTPQGSAAGGRACSAAQSTIREMCAMPGQYICIDIICIYIYMRISRPHLRVTSFRNELSYHPSPFPSNQGIVCDNVNITPEHQRLAWSLRKYSVTWRYLSPKRCLRVPTCTGDSSRPTSKMTNLCFKHHVALYRRRQDHSN